MKFPVIAVIISMMLAGSSHAVAQSASAPSTDVIMQRLDALDKRNARLESENAALRDRMRLLEAGKRNPSTTASLTKPAPSPASALAMVPKSSTSGVYKAYNWTGFYVGAHLGGGLASKQWTDLGTDLDPQSVDAGSHQATGPLGGIQGGYNWQMGHLVLGVEGQYSFSKLSGDHQDTTPFVGAAGNQFGVGTLASRYSTKVDGIATLAGRVGFASDPIDRTLFYVTGGAAFARDKYALQQNGSSINCQPVGGATGCFPASLNGTFSGSQDRWGWMAGAGFEYGLTENWSAKVEYNYLDFGSKIVSLQGRSCSFALGTTFCQTGSENVNVNQNIQLIKLGINYRFNLGMGPVVAKY
jgi:outer membrane immunogenic protein